MEKFGIFELLDALSAMTDTPAEENKARTPDEAFAPPTYGMPASEPPARTNSAFEGFVARHEEARGRVKK